jgi:hypothetical protein
MLVLALQFSRCDRRLRNTQFFTGARRSGVGDRRDMKSDSLKTEEKTAAGVSSHERGTESLSTSRLLTTVNTSAPTGSVSRLVARNGHDDGEILLRKEVIQPHLPVRLPCYDFTPITDPTFDGSPPYGLGHRLRVLPTFVV